MALQFRELLAFGFAELNKNGIFPAQNSMCCQTCGRHAIESEVGLAEDATYAFYHGQDEDNLRESEDRNWQERKEMRDALKPLEVHLVWNGGGHRICEILRAIGLGVDWDGDDGRPDPRLREGVCKHATEGGSGAAELRRLCS